MGYSFLSNEEHVRFGKCIRAAIERVGRPVAFIASGDLSHRLKLEAPAGYNPQAHLFDEEVVDAIRSCATKRIVDLDPELRRMAENAAIARCWSQSESRRNSNHLVK